MGAATGSFGWTLKATGVGTTSLTGTNKNDTIIGNSAGGLTINGHGGTDSITLGNHKAADTIYLVNNAKEFITGFGGSTGTVADVLNVTAAGNALAGLTLSNQTFLAANNKALAANSSGLVFSYADHGTALTAASAAALFATTQTPGKFAIAAGIGSDLLIETGISSTANAVWEINQTSGVFTAIQLTGVTVAAGHNIGFAHIQ
jgi:hypothetical protein